MSEILKHTQALLDVPEDQRRECVDLLFTILENIRREPNNPKFRDMNFSKIRKKFNDCKPCFYLLYCAGFNQTADGSRLVLEPQNFKMLEHTFNVLDRRVRGNIPPEEQEMIEKKKQMEEEEVKKKAEEVEKKKVEADDAAQTHAALQEIGLDADEMELMRQIKASKDTTVTLSMAELQGLTKEEKIELLRQKQDEYRKEKVEVAQKHTIAKEKSRRENIKAMQEADEKRKDYEMRMIAQRKKREKEFDKQRKKRIKEKIVADKERRQKERELAERRKQQEQPQQEEQPQE
jgi:hypothetical protein